MTLPVEQIDMGLCPDACVMDTDTPAAVTAEATADADGANVLLDISTAGATGGNAVGTCYRLPLDSVQPLTESLTKAAAAARCRQTGEPDAINVHGVDWWTVRTVPGTPIIVISFRTPSGAEFSFKIHQDAACHMRETLAAALGYIIVPASTERH